MDPASLVNPELIKYCEPFNTIAVCGYTKTGKISIAKKLASELKRQLIVSDDYMFADYVKSLDYFMADVIAYHRAGVPLIVEGVLCFRLLRKGAQECNFYADLILKTVCDEETIKHFYTIDGEEYKIKRALVLNQGLDTIWDEYKQILHPTKRPKYIELNTSLDGR